MRPRILATIILSVSLILINFNGAEAGQKISKNLLVKGSDGQSYVNAIIGLNYDAVDPNNSPLIATTDTSGRATINFEVNGGGGVLFVNPSLDDHIHGIYSSMKYTNPSDSTPLEVTLPKASIFINVFNPDGVTPNGLGGIDTGLSSGNGEWLYRFRPGAIGIQLPLDIPLNVCKPIVFWPSTTEVSMEQAEYGFEKVDANGAYKLFTDKDKCIKEASITEGVYSVVLPKRNFDPKKLTSGALAMSSAKTASKVVTLAIPNSVVTIKAKQTFQAIVPNVQAKSPVVSWVEINKKIIYLSGLLAENSGNLRMPTIQGIKPGNYQITYKYRDNIYYNLRLIVTKN